LTSDFPTLSRYALLSGLKGGIIKFVIYILASINFLRSGSLVKRFMGKKKKAEPNISANSDTVLKKQFID